MKFTKRITSLLLVFVLISASLFTYVQAADFSDVPETNAFAEAISELVGAGVINGYEDGTFKPDATITRAEFAKILAVAAAPTGYQFTAVSTTFSDIPDMNADHGWAVPYIAYAVSTKAVNGYTDGTFQPGNPVTYGEAIKMLVCTLGYGPVIDTTLTPWYQGYINVAQQIGLTKGAVSLGDTPASRGIVAQITSNMLGCAPLVQTGVDENGQPIYSAGGDSGSSFDENKDNSQSGEGIFMGVTEFSLDGTEVGRNQVQIDDQIYTQGNLDFDTLKSYVGKRVTFSYAGSGNRKELVKVIPVSSSNSEIVIDPEMLDTIDTTGLKYFKTEDDARRGKSEKISFGSNLRIVYNGNPVRPADISTVITGSSYIAGIDLGSIKVLSNDASNGSAEVLFVEKYDTYFANTPLIENGKITIFDSNKAITTLNNITIDEDDLIVSKVDRKDNKPSAAAVGAIQKDTVVSIALPYSGSTEGTNVIVSTIKTTGDVNGLADDTVTIGSTAYELSPYYKDLIQADPATYTLSLGDNATFYMDYLGRITFMKKNEKSNPYGMVMDYRYGTSGLNSEDSVMMLTTNNTRETIKLKSEVKVNGVSKSSAAAISDLVAMGNIGSGSRIAAPVVYKTYDGKITDIEILSSAVSGTYKYIKTGSSFKNGASTAFTMLTSGSTDAATVFVVPNDRTNDAGFEKRSGSLFKDDTNYEVAAYDMVGTNAKIIVCYLGATQTTKLTVLPETPVYIVESMVGIANDAKRITFRNMFTDETSTIDSGDDIGIMSVVNSLAIGDLVKYVTQDGEISDIRPVYSVANDALCSSAGEAMVSANHYRSTGSGNPEYYQAVHGTIYNFNAQQLQIIPDFFTAPTPLDTSSYVTVGAGGIKCYQFKDDNNDGTVEISAAVDSNMIKYADYADTTDYSDAERALATRAVVVSINGKTAVYIDKR